jgi:hypothetical protein
MPIRGFQTADIIACFDEAAGGGTWNDINAPRNAPAKTPGAYLDKLYWHSDCFQYEIAAGPTDVTINHTALATKTEYHGVIWNAGSFVSPTPQGVAFAVQGDQRSTDILLLTHGLGYVPKAMVVLDDRMLPAGYLIQNGASGSRMVSVFATTTGIFLREHAVSGPSNLAAISKTYTVMVFRTRAPDPAEPLFGFDGSDMVLARGIVDSSRRYLRRTGVGDSPFSLNMGPTLDIDNGGVRSATGGTVVSESRYGGSMAAPSHVQVGV